MHIIYVWFQIFFIHTFTVNRFVGDNIDHEINARIQTKEHGDQSIRWTQQTVIRDSVVDPCLHNTKPRKSLDQLQLIDILPTAAVQSRLKRSWSIIVSRLVTKHLKHFGFPRNVGINHIPHQYSKEASTKSEIVSFSKCFKGKEIINVNSFVCHNTLFTRNFCTYIREIRSYCNIILPYI